MKPEPLLDAFAKTERTVAQIRDLNHAINAFFQTSPYEVASDLNNDGTKQIWRFRLTKKIPRDLSIRAGEILHNLRSPLDQMACAIAVLNGKSETRVCFPFGRDVNEFEAELRKQKKLPDRAHRLIRATKPYAGGNNLIWTLHYLNKRDKHRLGLVPMIMPAETSLSYLVFWRGVGLVIGSRTGKHLVMNKPFTEADLVETGKPLAFYDCRPGRIVCGDAGTPGDESLEFLTTTPGAKFETDIRPTLNISFAKVGLDGQTVVAVLNDMRQLVERILIAFEGRFFA